MGVERVLARWKKDAAISLSIQEWRTLPAQAADERPLPLGLDPVLERGLRSSGIQHLFSHQAQTWELIQQGKSAAILSGTASGKTLAYTLPVLQQLLKDPTARCLLIFPTKALAQDQLSGLSKLLAGSQIDRKELQIGIYDGDTPSSTRTGIRENSRLLITNPDMLHIGILPHHTRWAHFFENLKLIVIDEMHTYRGVFGSHVANVIRRLKRITRFYGSQPQFILTSATIANPGELANNLTGEDIYLVESDGSARGERHFLIYNPPVIDPIIGLRASIIEESIRLAQDLLSQQVQIILFGRSRRTVEIILTYLRQRMPGGISSAIDQIRGYRSGYLPHERREIERGLRSGQVQAVIATNALELGIDIGGMGAVIMVGYPGSIAATRQQAGRAGRGQDASLAVLITSAAPLDQFLASHPEYLFGRSPEHALIDPNNLLILLDHLRCAAFELPFQAGDLFGNLDNDLLWDLLDFLETQGILHRSGEKIFWMADLYPAQGISLRSASANPITLQVWSESGPKVIGQVDRASAWRLVHPQAIYLHEAQTFLVEDIDLEHSLARLKSIESDYYTEPRSDTQVDLIEEKQRTNIHAGYKAQGEIKVTTQLKGYRKIKWHTHEPLGLGEVSLPPEELHTSGYWISLDETIVQNLREQGLWKNDANQYGPNWMVQRDRARARDSYQCQVCGVFESGKAHHVHHKTPFRMFSSFLEANQLENLITLCPTCHQRVELAVRVRSGLAGLAYVLRNLAPFFLMCDPGDLGASADPQSSLTGGAPSVILYDQVPAGIGLSQRLFELHQELMLRAYQLVRECSCSDGCPSCVGPGGENGSGGKSETLAILAALAA